MWLLLHITESGALFRASSCASDISKGGLGVF